MKKYCPSRRESSTRREVKKGPIPYHIAFAIEGKKLICWGTNYIGLHAEMNVLKQLESISLKHKLKWSKISLIVVRVRQNLKNDIYFDMSKPCIECASSLRNSFIKNIYWSTSDSYFDRCRSCDLQSTQISRRNRVYS